MSVAGRPGPPTTWSGDAGARRLFARVRDACEGGEELPVRLESGLRAALGMLAADPELASLLTVDSHLGADDDAREAQKEWTERFGALLRDAAQSDPRVTLVEPDFLAPFLIGGVRFQISRLVLAGEAADLPRLLPSLLEGLLAYYFEPGDPRRSARAALRVGD